MQIFISHWDYKRMRITCTLHLHHRNKDIKCVLLYIFSVKNLSPQNGRFIRAPWLASWESGILREKNSRGCKERDLFLASRVYKKYKFETLNKTKGLEYVSNKGKQKTVRDVLRKRWRKRNWKVRLCRWEERTIRRDTSFKGCCEKKI